MYIYIYRTNRRPVWTKFTVCYIYIIKRNAQLGCPPRHSENFYSGFSMCKSKSPMLLYNDPFILYLLLKGG